MIRTKFRLAVMQCRTGCGACCIAPSISSAIPGMPGGKLAGVRCVHLDPDNRCGLFGRSERPKFCSDLKPSKEMCGGTFEDAYKHLSSLELATKPEVQEKGIGEMERGSGEYIN
jgi:Fe-S-cluster containining protein